MDWADAMQAFGENAEVMANTRIPYSSDSSRPKAIASGDAVQFGTEYPDVPYETKWDPRL